MLERAAIALDRIRDGRAARSLVLYGLRGVGKTVLLNRIREDAESRHIVSAKLEATEDRSLPGLLVPQLRAALLRLSTRDKVRDAIRKTMRVLANFASALKAKYEDIEFGLSIPPLRGIGDSGDLTADLVDLFRSIGEAAQERRTALVLYVDELQYVPEPELAALLTALHEMSQAQLPLTMVGAGLPQLVSRTGKARSYAERLFEFVPIDRLGDDAARKALTVPALREKVSYEEAAVAEVIQQTRGYPYFLQEWGKHCWDIAEGSPITGADATKATQQALAELDASFFQVRFGNLTPAERKYMRAMAELGPGPHRSGDIADAMKRKVTSVAPTRNSLIRKGMIYSQQHGDTAFTVPHFDEFMKRIMPRSRA